jgi:hypothetical protein
MTQVRIVIRWKPVRLPNALDRLHCLVGGHKEMMVLRNSNMALHCERCGRTTPGWQIDPRTSPRRA